jgi:uncharacterized protein YndB with AHSA1/START domain
VTAAVTLVVRRLVRASVDRVFAAWTEPEQLRRWWGPRPVTCVDATVDLRVGGSYRIGNLLPDGAVLWIRGCFEVVEPPHRLVYTWEVVGKEPLEEASRVTVRFESRGAATEVIVLHERIPSAAVGAEHEAGWGGCLDGLERMFAGGTTLPF